MSLSSFFNNVENNARLYLEKKASQCFNPHLCPPDHFRERSVPVDLVRQKLSMINEDLFPILEENTRAVPRFQGYHGSSDKALGKQIDEMEIENRGRFYTTFDPNDAVNYARGAASRDGGKPVIIAVYSNDKKVPNGLEEDTERLGPWSYFPGKQGQRIEIGEVYQVKPSWKTTKSALRNDSLTWIVTQVAKDMYNGARTSLQGYFSPISEQPKPIDPS